MAPSRGFCDAVFRLDDAQRHAAAQIKFDARPIRVLFDERLGAAASPCHIPARKAAASGAERR